MKVLHLLTFYLQTIWEEKSVSKGKKAFISSAEVIPKGLYSRKKIGTYEVQRQQIYFCLLVDGVWARDDLYSVDPLVSRASFGWLGGNIMPFLHTEECQTFRWWLQRKRKKKAAVLLYSTRSWARANRKILQASSWMNKCDVYNWLFFGFWKVLTSCIHWRKKKSKIPFLKGELCLFRLLLFLAHKSEEAEEDFLRAGLFRSASRCSFKSCSRFCFCSAIRCCCSDKLGINPAKVCVHSPSR